MERKKKNIIELTRIGAEEYRRCSKLPVKVALDNVRSLNNVGSVMRTSDAFLVDELLLCGITGTPPNPEIHKTALGAEESVEWTHHEDTAAILATLQREGWKVCVLEQTHNSVALNEFEPVAGERYVIVAGNEIHGVDQRVVDMADTVIEIPQHGTKHSLNVSVSCGIAIWHFYEKLINNLTNIQNQECRKL